LASSALVQEKPSMPAEFQKAALEPKPKPMSRAS